MSLQAEFAHSERAALITVVEGERTGAKLLVRADGRSEGTLGDPELDATYGLPMRQLEAALYLYEATGTTSYRQYFDSNYTTAHLIAYGNYADMFEGDNQETLLDYTKASGATPSVVSSIRAAYAGGMAGADHDADGIGSGRLRA